MTNVQTVDKRKDRRLVILGTVQADHRERDQVMTYNGEPVNEAVSDRILDADGDYVSVQLYAGDGLVYCPVTVQFDLGTDRATLQRLLRKVAADADLIFDHFDRNRSAVEDVTTAELAERGFARERDTDPRGGN